jgi:hypothetical protein
MAGTLKYLKLAPDPPPTSRIFSWNKKSSEVKKKQICRQPKTETKTGQETNNKVPVSILLNKYPVVFINKHQYTSLTNVIG